MRLRRYKCVRELNMEYLKDLFKTSTRHSEGKSIHVLPFVGNKRTRTMRNHFNETIGFFTQKITSLQQATEFNVKKMKSEDQTQINFLKELINESKISGKTDELE